MECQCQCKESALLPLCDPWYPANGYDEKEAGANVWCAACCDAWKVDAAKLAEVVAAAKAYDADQEARDEARRTLKKLEAWEAWCAQPEKHTTQRESGE